MSSASLDSLTPSERRYAFVRPSYSTTDACQTWTRQQPEPSLMADPGTTDSAEAAPASSVMNLAEVESLMYDHGESINCRGSEYQRKCLDPPLMLLKRFDLDVDQFANNNWNRRTYWGDHSASDREAVRRHWEQIFSSRLPPIEKPVIMIQGRPFPHPEHIEAGVTWDKDFWDETFLRRDLLPTLELIGDPEDHPSEAIRIPRALAEHESWQQFVKKQAHLITSRLGGVRNKWLPFLLTRPFVVFQVISDAERLDRGYSRVMVAQTWRQNGFWFAAKGSEPKDEPGWTWPGESPNYFIDGFIDSWELLDQPDDPNGRETRGASPPAQIITEEELADDPTLSKREGEFVALHRRQQRSRAREEAAAASAITVKNCVDNFMLPPRDLPGRPKKWVEVQKKPAREGARSQTCGVTKVPRKRAAKTPARSLKRRAAVKEKKALNTVKTVKTEKTEKTEKTGEAAVEPLALEEANTHAPRLRRSSRLAG